MTKNIKNIIITLKKASFLCKIDFYRKIEGVYIDSVEYI